jgi:peptidoglycan hydrolase-like protein with peptidoglycan-binding domain
LDSNDRDREQQEDRMKAMQATKTIAAIAVAAAIGGCSSWHSMDRTEGTAVGAAGGAVAGAVVAGPVGAVVGGVGGAYAGHETTGKTGTSTTTTRTIAPISNYDPMTVRSVQQALNDRGYNAGPVDGQYGAATQDAVRRFQQVAGLPVTGELERPTLNALGVS